MKCFFWAAKSGLISVAAVAIGPPRLLDRLVRQSYKKGSEK
jgi:hypothetical protein